MLSDVLFEAVEEIERCQADFAEAYAPYKDEIEEVKKAMRELQAKLDSPLRPGETIPDSKG